MLSEGRFFSLFCSKITVVPYAKKQRLLIRKTNSIAGENEKNGKFFQKTLDKLNFYAIILKCIIIAFFFGDILRFFQEMLVESEQKTRKKLHILTKSAKMCPDLVKFQEWSDSIYDA